MDPRGAGQRLKTEGAPPVLPAGLTESQRLAISATDPLLCILAAAGAGKTRVLTLRVARRIHDRSAASHHVLVCTFSRKAADELRQRLWALDADETVTAGTFHRIALHLLRQRAADRGNAPPVVLSDRREVLRALTGEAKGAASGAEAEIGWAKARMVRPDDYEEVARRAKRRPRAGVARMAELYERYEAERRRRGVLDLDDLLLACADALADDARFAAGARWRFRHLFVDEMQDVNPAQFRLLTSLLGDEPDLCVVGDPNQSVYGWNGADPTLLHRLPDLLPGTRVLHLDENHRSSPQVVGVASAALGLGEQGTRAPTSSRPDGPVPEVTVHPTDADEATWVARQVWRAHRPGRRWEQIAVLARTNAQLVSVAEALQAERIPHQRTGSDFGPAGDVAPESAAATDDAEETADHDAVVLSTFHRAKGLQWPAVFVVGLSEGLVPMRSARTPGARAEERRLLYVALTRAEDELWCSWAQHATGGDESGPPRSPSPWLAAVDAHRRQLHELEARPDPTVVAARLAELRTGLASDRSTGG